MKWYVQSLNLEGMSVIRKVMVKRQNKHLILVLNYPLSMVRHFCPLGRYVPGGSDLGRLVKNCPLFLHICAREGLFYFVPDKVWISGCMYVFLLMHICAREGVDLRVYSCSIIRYPECSLCQRRGGSQSIFMCYLLIHICATQVLDLAVYSCIIGYPECIFACAREEVDLKVYSCEKINTVCLEFNY